MLSFLRQTRINPDNPFIIAMDIDDFLTSMQTKDLRKQDCLDPVHQSDDHFIMVEFQHNDRHFQVENVLTPGCIEFFRFLFDHDYIRPAFFSSGIRSRNLDLAQKVVQRSIDVGGDPEWMNRYDVYSKEDCFDTQLLDFNLDREMRDKFQPKNLFGNYKKDLRVIYYGREKYHDLFQQTLENPSVLLPDYGKDENLLKNIILVEEDPSYLFPGQEKNMLLCPTYHHPYPYTVNYQGDDTPYDPDDRLENFKSSNTIFYAAGVLSHTFERYFADNRLSIPEILWQEQGIWMDRERYKKHYPIHFFTKGRDILRKYNPELNFAISSNQPSSQ